MKYSQKQLMETSPISNTRAILIVLNYFVGYLFLYPLLVSFLINMIDPTSQSVSTYIEWIIYLFMIIMTCYLGWPILKESYRNRPKLNRMLVAVLIAFFQLYFISAFGSIIASILSNSDNSANQIEILLAFKENPVMTMFLVTIYAPLVEEIVFRGALFRHLRSKFNFFICALISGFSFGIIHVMSSILEGNYADCWFLIVYMGLGILFSKVYEDNRSIYATMLLHFINNFISILVSIIIQV